MPIRATWHLCDSDSPGGQFSLRDYRPEGKRAQLHLVEKGNKEKLVWLHREAELRYIRATSIVDPEAPFFQTLEKAQRLTGEVITRRQMIARRETRRLRASHGLISPRSNSA